MSKKPSNRRSPQEKKKLSYERDRVNVAARNKKSARKNIRNRKTRSERVLRRGATELLKRMVQADDDVRLDADLADTTLKTLRHTDWRKYPDVQLSLVLDERYVKRHGAADRVRTRNVREAARASIELNASEEEQFAVWYRQMDDKRAAENAVRNAKRAARKAALAVRKAEKTKVNG